MNDDLLGSLFWIFIGLFILRDGKMALNAGKLYDESGVYIHAWLHPPAPQHDDGGTVYSNRFTEASRASPYFAGHIDQFAWPLLLILVVVEFARALV